MTTDENTEVHKITWHGRKIEIRYQPRSFAGCAHDPLLFQAGRFRKPFDSNQTPRREVAATNVLQVFCNCIERIDEKLSFCLEIAKLKDELNGHRDRVHAVDKIQFHRAQVEVKAAIVFSKEGQAVNIVDLLGSQDRQTSITDHCARSFLECKKYTFSHAG